MGCFLVMTAKDFQMIEMMNRSSKHEKPAYEKVQYISRVNNPKTNQQEILIKTDKELSRSIQRYFPETRKSQQQDSHHVFPQKHKTFFREIGIKIDNYTVLLDQKSHLQMTSVREGYTNAWNQFVDKFKDSGASANEIKQEAIRYAGQLMTTFGFNDGDINLHKQHNF